MGLVGFMASPAGRITRAVAGIVLIVIGAVAGGAWRVLAVVGLVPLLAGIFDVCVVSPLFGGPFRGAQIRAQHRS